MYGQDFERGVYSPIEQELRQHLGDEKYKRLWQDGQQAPIAIVDLIDKGAVHAVGVGYAGLHG